MIKWWNREDYNYCYLVPFIVLYLIWEKRKDFAATPSSPSRAGFPLLLLGIGFYFLGELGGEYYTLYLSSWLLLIGICLLHLGWRKLKTILFPLFFILTMFPPPNFIYNKVSVELKLLSSQLGVTLMQLYGMSAYREGNIIDLGFTQLQVVDACSGLRYLIPLIVLGILLAYFFKAAFWKRAFLVISVVPLSIITNSLRIALTGIFYEVWGPSVAEGFFHGFSGWFIFMFSLALLLLEMKLLIKIFPEKFQKISKSSTEAGIHVQPKSGVFGIIKQPCFLVAVICLGATLALTQGIEFREKIPISKSFDRFPLQLNGWSGTSQSLEQQIIDALDFSDYKIIDFKNKKGQEVNFYVAYYESQRKGESIHSPATCLPGSGWIFNKAGTISIPLNGGTMEVNRALMQKGDYKQLSYYWFPQRGRILTNAYQLKIFVFWDALTRQRTDGSLVRLVTPIYYSEKEAEQRLQKFTADVVPILNTFLPQ